MNPLARLWSSVFPSPAERTLAELRTDLKRAERKLREAYDYVQDWERERDDLLGGGTQGGRRGARKDGDQWPYLRNMEDLNRYRTLSREAVEGNGYGAGMLDRAVDFVIGDGMQVEVTLRGARKGAVSTGVADADGDGRPDADPAVQNVQAVIDDFRRLNDWGMGEEDREEEGFRRSQRDGEVFVRFFRPADNANGVPLVRWIEPEQVDAAPGEPEYRWGIKYKKGDVESKEEVYVYEPNGTDGEWVPFSDVVFHKLGTDRTVLRGMPLFWLVASALDQCDKLNSACAEVSAIQAQIAYVREHAPGILPGQISEFVGSQGDGLGRKATPYGDKYRRVGWGENGTVVDMSAGTKFNAGPVSTGVPAFVQALQSRLRQVCARFGYPEFFTGDASNGNYASLLAAGGPAERAFKRRQNKYASFQASVYRKACEYAVKAQRLTAADLASVEIKVKPGKVSVSNNLEDAQIDQILIQNKVKSVQTVMAERGLDPRVETANIEAFDAKFGSGAMGMGGFGGQEQDPFGGGFAPTGEGYTQDEYGLLSEAQRSLLVKQVVTDKNGKKTTRWVRAGGTMDDAPAGKDVPRAQATSYGPGAGKSDQPTPKADAPKADPTPAAKSSPDLSYLPKDPKSLTVDQAERGLTDMGYTVVRSVGGTSGSPDDVAKLVVKDPDGNEQELTPTDVKRVLYGDRAVPKASRMSVEDLSRAYTQAGGGKILGPAAGEPFRNPKAYRVKNPDGPGELVVAAGDILRAVVAAGLAREGYTEDEYDTLSEAARAGLVLKQVGTHPKTGNPVMRYVRAEPKGAAAARKASQRAESLGAARRLIDKGVTGKAQAKILAAHLSNLTVKDIEGLKAAHAARLGGRLKAEKVATLVAYAQGRGSVKGGQAAPAAAPTPAPAPAPAATSTAAPATADLETAVMDQVRKGLAGRHAAVRMVPVHEIRNTLKAQFPGMTDEQFNEVMLGMRRQKQVRLVSTTDRGRATPQQLADSIRAVGETFFYVDLPTPGA